MNKKMLFSPIRFRLLPLLAGPTISFFPGTLIVWKENQLRMEQHWDLIQNDRKQYLLQTHFQAGF